MTNNKLYVFTQSQAEFWAREIGCKVSDSDSQNLNSLNDLIALGIRPIVEINQNVEKFQRFPKNSLIALLNTDEKYDTLISEACLKSDVFAGLIRQYTLPKTNSFKVIAAGIKGIMESFKIIDWKTPRRTLGWGVEGFGMAKRQRKIAKLAENNDKITIEIPLGYTDFFVESYEQAISNKFKTDIKKDESLLRFSLENNTFSKKKEFNFVFIGQIGQIIRRHAIQSLKKFESKKLVLREGYGGVSNDENRALKIGEEYVKGLFDSRISVCPPGNISGNSYRIMESLICGAFPAVMSNILCDPQFESPVVEAIKGRKPLTWARYLRKLERVSDERLQQIVEENIKKFRTEIQFAKNQLEALQSAS